MFPVGWELSEMQRFRETPFSGVLSDLGGFQGKEKEDEGSSAEKIHWNCSFPPLPCCSEFIRHSPVVSSCEFSTSRICQSTSLPARLAASFQPSLNLGLLNKMRITLWNRPAKYFSQNNTYWRRSGHVAVPVHLHGDFTTACPEMFLVLPFNTALNILSGLKIQDSIHLLQVSVLLVLFCFLFVCFDFVFLSFSSLVDFTLLHSSCIFSWVYGFFFLKLIFRQTKSLNVKHKVFPHFI